MVFETYRIRSSYQEYLFMRNDNGVNVIDNQGHNYGSWMSVESFKKALKTGKATSIGNVFKIQASL